MSFILRRAGIPKLVRICQILSSTYILLFCWKCHYSVGSVGQPSLPEPPKTKTKALVYSFTKTEKLRNTVLSAFCGLFLLERKEQQRQAEDRLFLSMSIYVLCLVKSLVLF